MQKFIYFISINVLKKTLDFSLVKMGEQIFHLKTINDEKNISSFLEKLKAVMDFSLAQALFCMENTGIYNHFVLSFLGN